MRGQAASRPTRTPSPIVGTAYLTRSRPRRMNHTTVPTDATAHTAASTRHTSGPPSSLQHQRHPHAQVVKAQAMPTVRRDTGDARPARDGHLHHPEPQQMG